MVEVTPQATEPAPATPAAHARGRNGQFVGGPGNPDAFERAVDEEFAKQEAVNEFAEKRREALTPSKAAPAKVEAQSKVATPVKAEAAPEDEPEPKKPSASIEAAKNALKRLKVPAKLLDALSETDLADWQGAISQVAASDSMSRELGELRKGVRESKAPKEESVQAEKPFDIEAELKPLELTLDEDAVKAFGQVLKRQQAHSDSKYAALEKRLDESILPEIERSKTDRGRRVFDEAKAGLVKRFPQLEDSEVSTGILKTMLKLNAEGEYPDAADCMIRACKANLLEETSDASVPPLPRPRRAASPITDTQRATPGPRTWDAAFDESYALLEKGKTVNEVRTHLRR